jgi:hypothetical protein
MRLAPIATTISVMPMHERERGDQGEQDERAVAGLREHHDPEQDRDQAGEDQQRRVAAVERQCRTRRRWR